MRSAASPVSSRVIPTTTRAIQSSYFRGLASSVLLGVDAHLRGGITRTAEVAASHGHDIVRGGGRVETIRERASKAAEDN